MNKTQYDAIVLPGSSLNPDESLSNTDSIRLQKAAELYKTHTARAIVVCGSHGYKAIEKLALSEAQAYANRLEELGVPSEAIHLEAKSLDSLGNFLFAKMEIFLPNHWRTLLVIPTYNHSTDRVDYLLKKVLGAQFSWDILRVGENKEVTNRDREAKSLKLTQEINDHFADGDHNAIHKRLLETHPAYGGTKWTVEELREGLKH